MKSSGEFKLLGHKTESDNQGFPQLWRECGEEKSVCPPGIYAIAGGSPECYG